MGLANCRNKVEHFGERCRLCEIMNEGKSAREYKYLRDLSTDAHDSRHELEINGCIYGCRADHSGSRHGGLWHNEGFPHREVRSDSEEDRGRIKERRRAS
ncbi:hypothetical protein GGR57DRAFT_453060 [Xylariaceae sp. FL1272]|nr:hypothetical protein GGR57DRAFT_453060 [Xylariaceae sp. FL1272]